MRMAWNAAIASLSSSPRAGESSSRVQSGAGGGQADEEEDVQRLRVLRRRQRPEGGEGLVVDADLHQDPRVPDRRVGGRIRLGGRGSRDQEKEEDKERAERLEHEAAQEDRGEGKERKGSHVAALPDCVVPNKSLGCSVKVLVRGNLRELTCSGTVI